MSTSNTQNLYTLQDEIACYVHYTSQQRNLTNTKISSLEKMHRDVVEDNMRLRQKVKELQSLEEKMIYDINYLKKTLGQTFTNAIVD